MTSPDDEKKGIGLNVDFGVGAKASYEISKKVTQEIPEDVTRARSGAWLDMISPITEWAGLKGDALRRRRDQLRIQQEAALEALATQVHARMAGRAVHHRLPAKIIVPALEKASLEEPDSPLIDWWANLLVSGATRETIRPFIVDLMSKVGNEEASLLEALWTNFPGEKGGDYHRILGFVHGAFQTVVDADFEELDELDASLFKMGKETISYAADKGFLISMDFIRGRELETVKSALVDDSAVPLDVCLSLKVIDKHEDLVLYPNNKGKLMLRIYGFSSLGIEFMRACRPQLEKRDQGT